VALHPVKAASKIRVAAAERKWSRNEGLRAGPPGPAQSESFSDEESEMNQRALATGQSPEAPRMKQSSTREAISAYLSLFASLATLFCCALPALLVLVGLSLTSVLTFFTAIPGWQNFGAYDIWLFPLCGALLGVGFYFAYFREARLQGETCESPDSMAVDLPLRPCSGDELLGNRLDEDPWALQPLGK
jgi:hypothetical protein